MTQQTDADLAKTRFFVISASRLAGALIVILGLLIVNQAIELPAAGGYGLVLFGMFDVFVLPQILIRKWRSPKE